MSDGYDRFDNEGSGGGSFVMGLLTGTVLGAGLGMLFAPKSGQETREMIKNKAGEGGDYIKQRGTEFKESASGWVDKGKDALNRQKDNLSDAMEAGKQAYRDTVSRPAPPAEGSAS